MNANELAQLLDMHPDTIRRLIREGKIKAKKKGRSYEIPQSEVQALQSSKGFESLGKAQAQAAYQLIVNLESEMASALSLIQLYGSRANKELEHNGITAPGHYDERMKHFEEKEHSYLHLLLEQCREFERLKRLKDEIQEIAKEAEQYDTLEKANDHWGHLLRPIWEEED